MKEFSDLKLSDLGVGTYLGELDQKTSNGYKEVIRLAVREGVNVIDTAIVYRYMKSERDIGEVLGEVGRVRSFSISISNSSLAGISLFIFTFTSIPLYFNLVLSYSIVKLS